MVTRPGNARDIFVFYLNLAQQGRGLHMTKIYQKFLSHNKKRKITLESGVL